MNTVDQSTDKRVPSRTVDWWAVHCWAQPRLDAVGSWPMAGTLAWQLLCDTDPAKWAALLDAAQHHILRVDTAQAALAEVSHDISTAANWQAVSREMLQRHSVYIPRKAS